MVQGLSSSAARGILWDQGLNHVSCTDGQILYQLSDQGSPYMFIPTSHFTLPPLTFGASLVAQLVKNPPTMWETWVLSLIWEDPLEKGKATHSSILAWRIPWTVESMGSQRIRHD